ncbi:hypothetical protein Q6307_27110, partial [Klebsiella pneumoniae]
MDPSTYLARVDRLQANLLTTLYCINVPNPQLSEAWPIPPSCLRIEFD